MTKYWWVNQNKTYRAEVNGGYMWSPKMNNNGGFNQFYHYMTQTAPGDIVFSFAGTKIKTVGVVLMEARSFAKPEEFGKSGESWDADGWLVQVDFNELKYPIKPKDHMNILASTLPKKYSPIRANGDGNQVYLAEIPTKMAEKLLSLIGNQVDVTLEQGQERTIRNRTDIGITEKYQLVRSRLGQGQYRKNLEEFENGCRITGISDGRFLTASHIKPWVKSNDFEKIDGNNGLLLSPHIDRLFDRGFITFENNGNLILNPNLPKEVANSWGITNGMHTRSLRLEQKIYMEYHREEIFSNKHKMNKISHQ